MPKFISEIINSYFLNCDDDYYLKLRTVSSLHPLISQTEQIDIKNIFLYLKQKGLLDYLTQEMDGIKEEYLYPSEVHGKNHNLRVMTFSLYLASKLGLTKEDIDLVMDSAKYHDIGRTNDKEDNSHGKMSAEKIASILPSDYPNLNMLKAIMELHSIDDDNFEDIANKYGINDRNKLRLLLSILKDADALDRVRLTYGLGDGYSSLDHNMLRLGESLKLIKATHQLNEYFVKHIKVKYKVILDTDTENEIDDKFAITYLLKSLDIFDIQAITIAPFCGSLYSSIGNNNYENIKEGIDKSYATTLKLMDLLNVDFKDKVFKGSIGFMQDGYAEENPAVMRIIDVCHQNDFTYILGIGALTNIALAIRKDPSILPKIHLIWLGGNSFLYNKNDEFNFRQDVTAVKTVFELVPNLTVIPCVNVASQLVTTIYELEHYLHDKGEIGTYLCNEFRRCKTEKFGKSKTIWDLAVIAYLINKNWFEEDTISRPSIGDNQEYVFGKDSRSATYVKRISRDSIFGDFLAKL